MNLFPNPNENAFGERDPTFCFFLSSSTKFCSQTCRADMLLPDLNKQNHSGGEQWCFLNPAPLQATSPQMQPICALLIFSHSDHILSTLNQIILFFKIKFYMLYLLTESKVYYEKRCNIFELSCYYLC